MVKSKELENYNEITLPKSEKEKKNIKRCIKSNTAQNKKKLE